MGSERAGRRANWFDRMQDIVYWRVEAPRPYNPFGGAIPTPLLEKLVKHKEALLRYIAIRGSVDGYEVICIKDVQDFIFESDHLVVKSMDSREMREYFKRAGLHNWLDQELNALQELYREELERRRSEVKEKETKSPFEMRDETLKQRRERIWREKTGSGDRLNRFYSGGQTKSKETEAEK